MKTNIENDYKNAIKAKCEKEKSGKYHGFLEAPSPAQLRELCLLLYDNGLNKNDEGIFRLYFKVSDAENLRTAIYNFHLPKFKTIQSLLTGGDQKTNILNLNFIAVLVDFNPRPFNKFSKATPEISNQEIEEKEVSQKIDDNNALNYQGKVSDERQSKPKEEINTKKPQGGRRKIVYMSVAGLFLAGAGFFSKGLILPNNKYMAWMEDHYELVEGTTLQGVQAIAYDPEEFNRKKLHVCDTTRFFRNGEPIVWYSKQNNEIEFFNMDGKNPETGTELSHITQYMIDKYVKE